MLNSRLLELAHPFGVSETDGHLRSILASLVTDPGSYRAALKWLEAHRVTLNVYKNCCELARDDPGTFPSEIAIEMQRVIGNQVPTDVFRREIARISAALHEERLPHAFVKGGALLALIPEYRYREMSDLDLVVPECRALWSVVEVLQKLGYRLDEDKENHWLKRSGQRLSAKVALSRCVEGFTIGLDIHTAEFAVGAGVRLSCPFWESTMTIQFDDTDVCVPSLEGWFVYHVVHRLVHASILQRDVNDLYAFLSRFGSAVDWVRVREWLHHNGLLDFASAYLQMVRNRFPDMPCIPLESARGFVGWLFRGLNERSVTGMSASTKLFVWLPLIYCAYTIQYTISGLRLQEILPRLSRQIVFCMRSGLLSTTWPEWLSRLVKVCVGRRRGLKCIPEWYPTYIVRLAEAPPRPVLDGLTVRDYADDQVLLVHDGLCSIAATPIGIYAVSQDLVFTREQWDGVLRLAARISGTS